MTNQLRFSAVTASFVLIFSCKCDVITPPGKPMQKDRDFVVTAAQGNIAEIQAGKLAGEKGNKDSVRLFGSAMVADHTKALKELDDLVNDELMMLPTEPDAEHKALKLRLDSLNGYVFDTVYMNAQLKDHVKTIVLFETEASLGTDAGLQGYAAKTLPVLKEHLMMAQKIRAGLD